MNTVVDITTKWRTRKLRSGSGADRIDAIDRIVKRGHSSELPLLIECLKDYEPLVRSAAAVAHQDWAALGRLGTLAIDPLADMLHEGVADQEAVLILERIVEKQSRLLTIQQLKKLAGIGHAPPTKVHDLADAMNSS